MPPAGDAHRTEQIAYLTNQRYRVLANPRVAEWLDTVEASPLVGDPGVAATIRVIRLDHDSLARVPARLVKAVDDTSSKAVAAWRAARAARDFKLYRPHLDAMIARKQEEADILRDGRDQTLSRHDVFYGFNDPGATTREYEAAMMQLHQGLHPLLDCLSASSSHVPPYLVGRSFPAERLEALAAVFAERIGLDRAWGRFLPSFAHVSVHIGPGDERIATKCEVDDLFLALLLTAHETGHARYHHALDQVPFGEPFGEPASMSVNEAHARLWEAIICKMPEFWVFAYPLVQEHFPDALDGVTCAEFVASTRYAIRSGSRARTDELSYCLFIGIRAEIEIALLDGTLTPGEVSDAFDEKTCAIFGSRPDILRAALGDVHWAANWYGRYPTYVLGSIYAAQLWAAIRQALPDIREQIRMGQFERMDAWLWEHVQQYGKLYLPGELMKRATGSALDPESWIALMREQYGDDCGN